MEIYISNVGSLYEDSLFSCYLERMSKERKDKVLSYRRREDRALSLGVGILLEYGIKKSGCHFTSPVVYSLGEYEKPFFTQNTSVFFNLSHAGIYAVCAISLEGEIGVDVEKITDIDMALAEMNFTPEENDHIFKTSNPEKRKEKFFSMWVLKESFMKLTGKGLNIPLQDFSIHLGNPITVTQNIENQPFYFNLYDLDGQYKLASCRHTPGEKTKIHRVNFEGKVCHEVFYG